MPNSILPQDQDGQEIEVKSGPDRRYQEQDDPSCVQSPESACDDLADHKLPEGSGGDDHLVESLLIQTLYVQILRDGIVPEVGVVAVGDSEAQPVADRP